MNSIVIPFIISLIAGLSTLIGCAFIYLKPKNINNFIGTSLSFSGTIMILISVFELIPEGFFYLKVRYNLLLAVISLTLMILLGLILNKLINKNIKSKVKSNSNLYRVGVLSMIALMIHNLPDGIIKYVA
jgi:ZIP family zinc transporter